MIVQQMAAPFRSIDRLTNRFLSRSFFLCRELIRLIDGGIDCFYWSGLYHSRCPLGFNHFPYPGLWWAISILSFSSLSSFGDLSACRRECSCCIVYLWDSDIRWGPLLRFLSAGLYKPLMMLILMLVLSHIEWDWLGSLCCVSDGL